MSHALITQLKEQRANTWSHMTELLDAAANEKRDLSSEEETTWTRMNEDLDRIDQRVETITEAEARTASAEASMREIVGRPEERAADTAATELRAWFSGRTNNRSLDVFASEEARVLTKGTNSAGGYTVSQAFYSQLVQHQVEVSGVLAAGPTVLNTSSGEPLLVPKTSSYGSAAIVAEGGAIAASDPAVGQVTLGAFKYGKLLQISHELVNDSAFNLQGFIAQEAGRALGLAFGAHLATGGGSTVPSGVVTGASAGVTGAAAVAGVPTTDNLIDLLYSVIAPYRNSPSCGWLMRDATVAYIRKFKDTTNQYIWQPSLTAGTPDTLLGKPIYTDPNIAAIAATAKSVLFGDFSRYFVRQVEGVRFERSDDFAFNTDLVTYRALLRGDGALIDTTGAIKYFVGGAAS